MKLVHQVMCIKRTALLLALALVVVSSADGVYCSLHLNLAHIALARWAFTPGQAEPERYLSAAVRWGERAGAAWMDRHGHGERARALWERVTSDTWQTMRGAERAYRQAQRWEGEGQLDAALVAYQRAFTDDERWIEACYKVYQLAVRTDQPTLAQHQVQALLALVPEWSVTITLADGTVLLGYDLDEMSLEHDLGPIPIVLYWELPALLEGASRWQASGWTYIAVQNRLYQIGVVDNLLPNGGFERDLSTMAILPYGYQDLAYAARFRPDYLRTRHKLTVDTRTGDVTQVTVVANTVEGVNGMNTIQRIAVEPKAWYVMGGWMRVSGRGVGYLGGVWRTLKGEDMLYWYVARERPAHPWQQFTSATIAPDRATIFTPLALNMGQGEVYFDDLVFFQMPFPSQPVSE